MKSKGNVQTERASFEVNCSLVITPANFLTCAPGVLVVCAPWFFPSMFLNPNTLSVRLLFTNPEALSGSALFTNPYNTLSVRTMFANLKAPVIRPVFA